MVSVAKGCASSRENCRTYAAAVELGIGALHDSSTLVAQVVIPRLHEDMAANLLASTYFGERMRRQILHSTVTD